MTVSLNPERLKRYRDIARLLLKYGRSDLVTRAGLDEVVAGEEIAPSAGTPLPDELPADLERMGPAFIKLGQLLSTRADLLPDAYLQALSRLQDSVEPFSFGDVERVIEEELGFRLSKGFESFESTPMAAASLGQVHRAALRDGRLVAVKVQRPEVRVRVLEDIAAMEDVAGFLDRHTEAGRQFGFADTVKEFRKTILQELDYRDEAPDLMQRRMRQGLSASNLFTTALETKEFIEQLPGRVNRLLDAVANNELRMNVEVIDEGAVIDGLQKVANRITVGLVLAALIVGAAMLMQVETPFRLFGYPGFAMLLFLVAAGGGLWLAFSILTGDKTPRRKP